MRKNSRWAKNLFELIRRTSTDLPSDIETALRRTLKREKRGSLAWWALGEILENVARARKGDAPICQDTGALLFYFSVPVGWDTNALAALTREAVTRATRSGYLRQNTLDAVTGSPYEANVAPSSPVFTFEQGARKTVDVRLLMKGGGCENVSAQYSLPDAGSGADRDLEGVRRCALDALWRAQGAGCAPGVLGVCIGGDRATGHEYAKRQFLRRLHDTSRVQRLAALEKRILRDAQTLRIGPLGLGGNTTLLGVKIGHLSRLPASYFATFSYMCWACRRRGAIMGPEGGIRRWL